jgi:hypothetical protein
MADEEGLLSKGGRVTFGVAFVPMLVYILYGTFADVGPAGWLNEVQADWLNGSYYPKLTFLLLMLPAMVLAVPFGLAYDALARKGKFARRPEAPAGPSDPPAHV